MKKFLYLFIIMITFISFFKINVEAKSISRTSTSSAVYSFAQGSGSGSGSSSGSSNGGGDCSGLFTSDALDIIDTLLNYFRILAPVLLVVLVAVDFGSAVISQDNDAMKKAQSKVFGRAIGVVLTFFVPTIVKIILDLPGVRDAIEIPNDPLCGTMNSYPVELVIR